MGLWTPGKIENIVTPQLLRAVCEIARRDHAFIEEPTAYTKGRLLDADQMPINELEALDPETGDGAFDRVSHAMHTGETFASPNGEKWRVENYHGRPWTLRRVETVAEAMANPTREVTVRTIPETDIAAWLTASNGPHPNPYVARVEVTYSHNGMRAGYGIRRKGQIELWYN